MAGSLVRVHVPVAVGRPADLLAGLEGQEHPPLVGPVAEQHAQDHAEHLRHVIGGQAMQLEHFGEEADDQQRDQQADQVEAEEDHPAAQQSLVRPVPEGPQPVPGVGQDGGERRRDRLGGQRAETDRAVQKSRATQVGDQTYSPDQAKLRQLSDEGGEAPVQVCDEAHEPEPSLARRQARPAP